MRHLKTFEAYESDINLLINDYLSNLLDNGYSYIIECVGKNHYTFRLKPKGIKYNLIQWCDIKYDILPFLEIFRNQYDVVEIEDEDGESDGNVAFLNGKYYNFHNLDEFIKKYNIDSNLPYNFYELYFEFRRKK